MILPNPDRLNRFNKYALVMLAAKRAKQLQEQGIARRALVNSSSQNPLTIALEEVAAGRLVPSFNPEPLPELIQPEPTETILSTQELEEAIAKMAAEAEPLDSSETVEDTDNSQGVLLQSFLLPGETPQDEAEPLLSEEGDEALQMEDAEFAGEDLEEEEIAEDSADD